MNVKRQHSSESIAGLRVIAAVKIAKGVLLTGIALGLFRSINHDLGDTTRKLAAHFRIDPENHLFRLVLEKTTNIDPHKLRTFGLVSLFFAAELYIEGVGLWLNQTWAKYLVLIATTVFIPDEIRICIRKFSWEHLALFLVNLGVLFYVIVVLLHRKRPAKAA